MRLLLRALTCTCRRLLTCSWWALCIIAQQPCRRSTCVLRAAHLLLVGVSVTPQMDPDAMSAMV